MYVRLLSDLHTEMGYYEVEALPTDSETVLLVPGDIGYFKHALFQEYMIDLCCQFREVIHVPGNHEYWGTTLHGSADKFNNKMIHYPNYNLLDDGWVVVDDVLFIGSTMWTDYRGQNPLDMLDAEAGMNDFRKIRLGGTSYRKIRATDIVRRNQHSVRFIFDMLKERGPEYRKVVVLTHHGPSYQSIPDEYKGQPLNTSYVNNLDYQIAECGPDLWTHGHTHFNFDYMIENTRVVVNPKGYPMPMSQSMFGHENGNFKPRLLIEI